MVDDGQPGQVPISLENRPAILVVGSSNVGKRTLLSRLVAVDFEDAPDSSPEIVAHGWTINTKYYTADVSVWIAQLYDELFIETLPIFKHLVALVMVFDRNDLSSFVALQDWIARTDIRNFEILLCIGNKVDLVPGHPVHAEYRRQLLKEKHRNSSSDFQVDLTEYGISETEGSSLLREEEPGLDSRRLCMEWCTERNIEFVEACASNPAFDKCLSVDGDSQGVERVFDALSAHMWPGMVLKSGKKIADPYLFKEDLSEDESEYEIEYEILSAGSVEPWDERVKENTPENKTSSSPNVGISETNYVATRSEEDRTRHNEEVQLSTSTSLHDETSNVTEFAGEPELTTEPYEGTHLEFEDLEELMSEIGTIRDNLRLIPDFQRRDMAANFALKMAAMFGDNYSDDGEEN